MTLVIVGAAIVALILLVLIIALSRSRFADESERFRYVSDLTSKWSRQQQTERGPEQPAQAAAQGRESGPIDLRDQARPPAQESAHESRSVESR